MRTQKEGTLLPALQTERPPSLMAPHDLERLYHAQHDRVYRVAYRVTGSMPDAEDVVQNVFLRLARRGTDVTTLDNPDSYFYRAGTNAALDLLRARRAESSIPLEEAGLAGQSSSTELRRWLRQAISKLNPRHAEMFVLRYLEGHDNKEIAQLLHTSQAVVAVTLHRVRQQLQKDFRTEAKGTR